jgi:hypothetical protein
MCSFPPRSAVEEVNTLPHLEHMNGSIVEKYAETFADEEDNLIAVTEAAKDKTQDVRRLLQVRGRFEGIRLCQAHTQGGQLL